ncbi:hypothetical protein, partial [Aeromonas jandaei]|uniref:hypothetical protein n=1 Tax=Aeromonas jandaei TaxID=650 RepID=UPI0038B691B9
ALHSGITTMIGGGTGPNTGTNATTCTPGEFNIQKMIESVNDFPLNFDFMRKGNSTNLVVGSASEGGRPIQHGQHMVQAGAGNAVV